MGGGGAGIKGGKGKEKDIYIERERGGEIKGGKGKEKDLERERERERGRGRSKVGRGKRRI